MALADVIPSRVRRHLEPVGAMYTMGLKSFAYLAADLVKGRFLYREFIDRAWFLANATSLPALLVSAPLGMAIVLQVGGIASQIGASSYVGAADAIGVLREASPIVTALLLAGVGGSAVCAELGARTIREEIDAMEVMGLNPLQRIVGPLLLASLVVSLFLNFLVIFVSIVSGYYFDLAILHGTQGSYVGSFAQFASMPDLVTSEIKAAVFGVTAGLIAAYKGMTARKGPTAVGEAVNQSVVITGIVLFAENLIITEVFFALVPQSTI
ncbi:MAG TPA: ABC transporter permease [Jatrophihabitantaceae bacterium]|nr:ABC transporter permease [Jatrophihabitantaceae bacterium]